MTKNGLGILLILIAGAFFWFRHQRDKGNLQPAVNKLGQTLSAKPKLWTAPDSNRIPHNDSGRLILYGKELIHQTARFFGPGFDRSEHQWDELPELPSGIRHPGLGRAILER